MMGQSTYSSVLDRLRLSGHFLFWTPDVPKMMLEMILPWRFLWWTGFQKSYSFIWLCFTSLKRIQVSDSVVGILYWTHSLWIIGHVRGVCVCVCVCVWEVCVCVCWVLVAWLKSIYANALAVSNIFISFLFQSLHPLQVTPSLPMGIIFQNPINILS